MAGRPIKDALVRCQYRLGLCPKMKYHPLRGWIFIFFLLFSQRLLTYTHVYSIIIDRKEVKTLSKKKQKKSGNKKDQPASTINLITAIVNLVIAILLLIEKLTR